MHTTFCFKIKIDQLHCDLDTYHFVIKYLNGVISKYGFDVICIPTYITKTHISYPISSYTNHFFSAKYHKSLKLEYVHEYLQLPWVKVSFQILLVK